MRPNRPARRVRARGRPLVRVAFALLLGAWASPEAAGGAAVPPYPPPHDLHVAYADLAVEGAVVAGRIRIFKDDLERALGPMVGADAVTLTPGPEADALVTRYLEEHLRLHSAGAALELSLLDSGEDELDREPVWWVLVQLRAPAPVRTLTVRNTLLFELFDDQRNILKLVHFPGETQRTYYFAPGEEEHTVRFPGGAG